MKIETYQDETGSSTVKNVAFCDIHTPSDSDVTPLIKRVNDESDPVCNTITDTYKTRGVYRGYPNKKHAAYDEAI